MATNRGQTPNLRYAISDVFSQGRIMHALLVGPTGNWATNGTPDNRIAPPVAIYADIARRLYAKVDFDGPETRPDLGRCWQWRGSVTGSGLKYGQIMCRALYASPQKTHRIAWELAHGPVPAGLQVNHHCDNSLCVRVEHLYLGTQAQNLRDASVRGRFHVPHSTRVLAVADREAIYSTPGYRGVGRDLAARYGVSDTCISGIRRGRFIRARQPRQHLLHNTRFPSDQRASSVEFREGGGEFVGCGVHAEQSAASSTSALVNTVHGDRV